MNTLQFPHCCYALEDVCCRWKEVNPTANIAIMTKLQRPVLTTWGYVNRTAESVLSDFDCWINMFKECYENSTKKDATISAKPKFTTHMTEVIPHLSQSFSTQPYLSLRTFVRTC